MTSQEDLIEEARNGDFEDRDWMIGMIDRLTSEMQAHTPSTPSDGERELERKIAALESQPEWETERVEEARIHYRYGVNSGTLAAWNTPESIAVAIEDHERRTMGPIGVERIEVRSKVTSTPPWVAANQEGESRG